MFYSINLPLLGYFSDLIVKVRRVGNHYYRTWIAFVFFSHFVIVFTPLHCTDAGINGNL